jgi:hypothetical protein
MPTEHRNQTYDADGNLIAEEVVMVPDPLVSDPIFQQSLTTMKNMLRQFTDPATGVPTGTPTINQVRNWLVAITHGVAYTHGALEDLDAEP